MSKYIKTITLIVISLGLIMWFNSCSKENKLPIVSTAFISDITQTSAVSGGEVTDNGSVTIIARGIYWGTSENLSSSGNKTLESGDLGPFVSTMTPLTPGTEYFVRAYATNENGTSYGEIMGFTTNPVSGATVTTNDVTSISSTGAVSGGNIVSDGGGSITARGVCWATTANPEITNNKTSDGTGPGIFSSNITGLKPGNKYFVRAYAANISGTTYGADVPFTTATVIPTITTTSVTGPTQNTATTGGNITDNGGSPIIAKGVCYGTAPSPSLTLGLHTMDGTGDGAFTTNLVALNPGTTYYVRAYATNNVGTAYGAQESFVTGSASLPIITTATPSLVTFTLAKCGGNVINDGGSIITARGICWAITTNPTIANNKITETGTVGIFTSTILRLTPGNKYYFRAYATNSVGTSYGNQFSFTTSNYNGTATDIDGNIYNTVIIGTQVWMAENLKTTKYRNGNLIGTTSFPTQNITNETTPKYQWAWDGNEGNVSTLGRLYTWYAITDSRNVCPTGWHVPSQLEWTALTDYLTNNGYGYEGSGGDISKSMANGWNVWPASTNLGAIGNDQASNNSSGFNAFQTGRRVFDGRFDYINYCYWWSVTTSGGGIWSVSLHYSGSYPSFGGGYDKRNGMAVRCVKD